MRDGIMGPEELRRLVKTLAEPVDFEALVAQGILRPYGKTRYEVLAMDRLPENASGLVIEVGNGPNGYPVVRFQKPSKSFLRMAAKLK